MTKKKRFYETYASLILAVVLIMSTVMITQATVYPGVPAYPAVPGKLMAVVGNVPEWGYYGGYHAMWNLIMPQLSADIGFSTANPAGNYWAMADDWSFYDIIWDEPGWEASTQDTNPAVLAPHGWDLTAFEWWTMPVGMLWQDGIILAQNIPPTGYNVWPYLNPVADQLYWGYQAAEVAADRKAWIDDWQLELMRDPVMANVYSPYVYDIWSSYVTGWYGSCWFYDIRELAIDDVELAAAAVNMSSSDYARLQAGTLKFGVTEDWWSFNPVFVDTYTEETMANLITGCLYALSLNPWPAPGVVPEPEDYYYEPDLADGYPVFTDGGLTATIQLKDEVYWSDGEKFDAEDVVYTYNLNLVPAAKATARGDFDPIVSSVEVGSHPLEIVLHLERPYQDLTSILANSWGLGIIAEHYYSDCPDQQLKGNATNYDAATHMTAPYLGPFHLAEATVEYLRYEAYEDWWGNSTAGAGYHVTDEIKEFYLQKVEDAATRLAQIQTHEIDFGEYPTAPVDDFVPLTTHEDLVVFTRYYIATNGVWFNFNNPYLSNRYFRLAICYAIPYTDIWSAVLPSWGITGVEAGGNLVHPWSTYTDSVSTTVRLFNNETNPADPDYMPPYDHNATTANAYLNMWKLSRTAHSSTAEGPVGDADFNGIVELDDLLLYYLNLGLTEAQMDAASTPGNNIDADFNNDNIVDDKDKDLIDYGVYYPDGTKTKTYPY